MIKVNKDLTQVPASLRSKRNEKAFESNIQAGEYVCSDSCYKSEDVKTHLEAIYHRKCAFCEKDLLDTIKAIEHFRPKRKSTKQISKCKADYAYYWLALSWDNLLLACTQCNTSKGNCFDIQNVRSTYQQEIFANIHTTSASHQQSEMPLLLHPEFDDPEGLFYFDTNGRIHPENNHPRMKYTIHICNLNRIELIERRFIVINDFINRLNEDFLLFAINKDLSFFQNTIKAFVKKVVKEEEFSAWRNYIVENFEKFIFNPNNPQFNTVVKLAFLKYK